MTKVKLYYCCESTCEPITESNVSNWLSSHVINFSVPVLTVISLKKISPANLGNLWMMSRRGIEYIRFLPDLSSRSRNPCRWISQSSDWNSFRTCFSSFVSIAFINSSLQPWIISKFENTAVRFASRLRFFGLAWNSFEDHIDHGAFIFVTMEFNTRV